MVKYISLDCETTGLDLYHGAKPFFVTTCIPQGDVKFYEWDVDPLTREPIVSDDDLHKIWNLLRDETYEYVLHNAKFDVKCLESVMPDLKWPWERTHDTLIMAHMLESNQDHDLTSLAMIYMQYDIKPVEKQLEVAVKKARNYCRRYLPDWRLAKKGEDDMPSAKDKTWKADCWLPKALAPYHDPADDKEVGARDDVDHIFWHCLQAYANEDSPATIGIFLVMKEAIKERGLEKIYAERMKVVPIAHQMERRGVSINQQAHCKQTREYREESRVATVICENIAESYGFDLTMPKGSVNDQLREFVFDVLKLPVVGTTDSGNPSMDADALDEWLLYEEPGSKPYVFIEAVRSKRKRDKALESLANYEKFWLPWEDCDLSPLPCQPCENSKLMRHWRCLHPNLNPTGTATLRWSSNNPNEQNISKKEGFNLRESFGPAPGREWWSLDAQNLELRIPTFKAGEEELMNVFLRPKDPPYFGSYHLVIFDLLHPHLFKEHGKRCKELYESTWYQWIKNGNFAVIYGAQRKKADATYRVPGAFDMIQSRFPKIAALSKYQISQAKKNGWVLTIPDKSVDPTTGYPLMTERSAYEPASPTKPFNYYVQGSACWWMMKAMIRVSDFFDTLNRGEKFANKKWLGGYYLALQVHDELVPDMPSGRGKGKNAWEYNLPVVMEVKRLMELGGEDLNVPTPVSLEYNSINWSTGISL